MNKIFHISTVPLLIVTANFAIFVVIPSDATDVTGDVLYNVIRAIAYFIVGILAIKSGHRVPDSAIFGGIIFFFEHVILKGFYFLVTGNDVPAFIGVLLSFAIGLPVAVFFCIFGACVSKKYYKSKRMKITSTNSSGAS